MKQRFSNNFLVPDLAMRDRDTGYAKGKDGYERILRAALSLLVDEGYRAVTMRRVAAACDMKLGNLTYYFPTKEDLVRDLLEAIIASYEVEFDAIVHEEGTSPIYRLEELCVLLLEDIGTRKTTQIFPELWALSNHDPFVFDRVQELYARARAPINAIIAEINPALSEEQRAVVTLFISAAMEGLTMFAGHGKPYAHRMPWLERISTSAFVKLVTSITPEDLPE